MVKEIPLQNGMFAIVDAEDYERCMEYVWTVTITNETQLSVRSHVLEMTLSQFLLGDVPSGRWVNSIDGNNLNFLKENLKIVDRFYSARHSRARRGSTSKYKGVYWSKSANKWVATLRTSGKSFYLGCFDSEDDAAEAYNEEAKKHWGEDCYLNKVGKENRPEELEFNKFKNSRRRTGKSEYKGVHDYQKNDGWISRINYKGKGLYLGVFKTELEAAKAYDKKAIELHGDKAILNFPNEVKI